jgi:hypothetical protein
MVSFVIRHVLTRGGLAGLIQLPLTILDDGSIFLLPRSSKYCVSLHEEEFIMTSNVCDHLMTS